MPDVHVFRHGNRWAVADAPGATPYFESATREEAESEARQRAGDGGRVVVADDAGEAGSSARSTEDGPATQEGLGTPDRPGEGLRQPQAGL